MTGLSTLTKGLPYPHLVAIVYLLLGPIVSFGIQHDPLTAIYASYGILVIPFFVGIFPTYLLGRILALGPNHASIARLFVTWSLGLLTVTLVLAITYIANHMNFSATVVALLAASLATVVWQQRQNRYRLTLDSNGTFFKTVGM